MVSTTINQSKQNMALLSLNRSYIQRQTSLQRLKGTTFELTKVGFREDKTNERKIKMVSAR